MIKIENKEEFCRYLDITLKDLNHITLNQNNYKNFMIIQKNNKRRLISSPSIFLHRIQTFIRLNILESITFDENIIAYQKGKSCKTGVQQHVNSEYFLSIDLTDFFGSITYSMVHKFFSQHFNLEISHLLTTLCTDNKKTLPQGACTSPILSNIVCHRIDAMLGSLCKKNSIIYTRYSDDLTFSSKIIIKKNFIYKIEKILNVNNFDINKKKTRYSSLHRGNRINGLTIKNNEVFVCGRSYDAYRDFLYKIEKFGKTSIEFQINIVLIQYYINYIVGMNSYISSINHKQFIKIELSSKNALLRLKSKRDMLESEEDVK